MTKKQQITDDLDALLDVLPLDIRHAVEKANDSENLLEIILDLGRVPTVRFVDREISLRETEITRDEIDYVDERTGEFDADNRAGIERTLHRISAIRNRRGHIVGLTLRVGRAVYGTVDIIQDIIESGKSVLILGRPGVGKTTLLREAARILAENKRVVIVDTSNEIGGDGDVPHPAVGKARRMQVREPMLQHEVMIEAVENHNPEVIVIDEIGRELEALAARTIAERGVQLIGTAHGQTLDNLLAQPDPQRPCRRHRSGHAVGRGSASTRHPENGPRKTRPSNVRRPDRDPDPRSLHRPPRHHGIRGCAPARLPAAS
jgi:stage III sporulation protein SpoIIIAA